MRSQYLGVDVTYPLKTHVESVVGFKGYIFNGLHMLIVYTILPTWLDGACHIKAQRHHYNKSWIPIQYECDVHL